MMKSGRALSLLALVAVVCLANTAAATELTDGQRITIDVPQDGAVTDLFINVPPGTESMRVELTNGAGNLDLFVRKDDPFTTEAQGVNKGLNIADFLRAQATYISFSPPPEPDEFVIITNRMLPPLTSGTWYFAVSNMNIEDTSVRIEVNFDDVQLSPPAPLILISGDGGGEGFEDPGPWFGLGGNEADTLGEARRNAFEHAMDVLAATLDSPVPIYIVADWRDDMETGTLASAGPDYLFHDTQGLPLEQTWYAGPASVRLGGTEACRLGDRDPCLILPDKGAAFRGDISVNINANQSWWLGIDAEESPQGQFDFVDVIMHEILHGLGIITFMDRENGLFLNGETLIPDENGIPDIYAVNMASVLTGNFVDISSGQRADAIVSGSFLHFTGPFATTSPFNFYADEPGDGHMLLHAPLNLQLGSSTSHIHSAFGAGEIMTSTVSSAAPRVGQPGIAMDMLWDLGWAPQDPLIEESPVALGMGYDRSRSGHGYDFQQVGDLYFLVFYTYESVAAEKGVANADPTWYLAVGTVKDGVFTTDANGLQRFTYNAANNPPQSLDGTFEGDVSITFGVDADHPNCDDGVNRNSALSLAAFDWTIGADSGSWCTEPLVIFEGSPDVNPTGHWFAGASDQGWGMTVYFQGMDAAKAGAETAFSAASTAGVGKGPNTLEFLVLYFYDALGIPRWVLGVKQPSGLSNTVNMDSFKGFSPAADPVPVTTTPAGTIEHLFSSNVSGMVDLGVTAPGGDWLRDDTAIEQLSNPAE